MVWHAKQVPPDNKNYIDLNVFCHTRAAYERLVGFNAELKRLGDWDLILRSAQGARSVPYLLSHYYSRKANNSISATADLQGPLQAIIYKRALPSENNKNPRSWIMQQPGVSKPLQNFVTVVIPNYGSLPELLECIKSVFIYPTSEICFTLPLSTTTLPAMFRRLFKSCQTIALSVSFIMGETMDLPTQKPGHTRR